MRYNYAKWMMTGICCFNHLMCELLSTNFPYNKINKTLILIAEQEI